MLRVAVLCVALVCAADATLSCSERTQLILNSPTLIAIKVWDCDSDGSYSAKQCLGPMCFCMAASGEILGFYTPINESAHQTCVCARAKDNYEKLVLRDPNRRFNCTDDGSYPTYQCYWSKCICLDINGDRLMEKGPPVAMDDLDC